MSTSDNIHLSGVDGQSGGLAPDQAFAVDCKSSVMNELPEGDERVRRYIGAARSSNTVRAYRSDLAHFVANGGTVPAEPSVVAGYLAAMAGQLSNATLERRLIAIGQAHTNRELPNPCKADIVRLTFRGIRRVHGRRQRQARAISKAQLENILSSFGETLRDRRDRALLLLGFYGAFRRSELVALDFGSLSWSHDGLTVQIARSKTDQERKGRAVDVSRGSGLMCPVAALEAWLAATCIDQGPLFRRVSSSGSLGAQRLSAEAANLIVKSRVETAGYESQHYSGHSLRAGFVTEAALAGWPTWRIREQTGHASDETLARYIRTEGKLAGRLRGL
jgi:integrase